MKLVTAVVNKKDTYLVTDALREEGFFFTKISSSGGFLREGNCTLLMGVEDDKLEKALEVIRTHCAKRTEIVPAITGADGSIASFSYIGTEVVVGGATVFVSDIERFEKM